MRLPGSTVLLVCLVFCVPATASDLRIVASVEEGPRRPGWVYARKGQRVTLHAQLPRAREPQTTRWFRLEPDPSPLDNTQPQVHYERVRYTSYELKNCRDRLDCPADVTPIRMPRIAGLDGVGTMAFQVRITLPDGRTLETPGIDSIERGGLSRDVFRVAVRSADGYPGYLTELLNTPYIFGSHGPEDSHQADLLIGSDCADLAVYGARRAGLDVPYVSTWTLDQHAKEIRRAERPDPNTHALDSRGRPLRIGDRPDELRAGDLLLFPRTRHVAVLWEDRPPLGVLDTSDLMLHTCWAPPMVEPISASGCASFPIRVLRFPLDRT